MMKIVAVLLVAITACAAEQNHNDVTQHLGWFRIAHGGQTIPSDETLVFKAFEATNAVCKSGLGHHAGTEAEHAALNIHSFNSCVSQRDANLATIKRFYREECPLYRGSVNSNDDNGHFTQIVWQDSTKYGMWAQTCKVPGQSCSAGGCCVTAFKSDGLPNLPGEVRNNIDFVGQCVDAETPWFDVCRRIDC